VITLSKEVKTGMALKIALAVVSILLVLTTSTSIYLYTAYYSTNAELENQVNSLVTERDNLKAQVSSLVAEKDEQVNSLVTERDNLKEEVNSLVTERGDLEAQIIFLQNQISDLEDDVERLNAPKLVTALAVTDQRPIWGTPYFEISGTVWNVGTYTATNCRLHIILYQGSAIAEDTYISLITINGESYRTVDEKIFYAGTKITDWEIIPEMD